MDMSTIFMTPLSKEADSQPTSVLPGLISDCRVHKLHQWSIPPCRSDVVPAHRTLFLGRIDALVSESEDIAASS
jgi:hypothetical protein